MSDDKPVKRHLRDCSAAVQQLVRGVAEAFKETLTWPTANRLHLLQQDLGVSEYDAGHLVHSAFDFYFEDQKRKARLNLWALYDTGLFDEVFADARKVVGRAYEEIRRTEDAVTVTLGDIGRQLRRSESESHLVLLEYVFFRSNLGYQSDDQHRWKVVFEVVRSKRTVPDVDELFLQRPISSWPADSTKLVAPGAFFHPSSIAVKPTEIDEAVEGGLILVDVEYPWEPPSSYRSIIQNEATALSLILEFVTWSDGHFSIRCAGSARPEQSVLTMFGERVRERLLLEKESGTRSAAGDIITVGSGGIGGDGNTRVAVTVTKNTSTSGAGPGTSGERWKWIVATLIALAAAGSGVAAWFGLIRPVPAKTAMVSSVPDGGSDVVGP